MFKTIPCFWSVVEVSSPEAHELIFPLCASSFSSVESWEGSKARYKSQIDIYDNDTLWQLYWPQSTLFQRGWNKIVALIHNTCSFSASVSITNIKTVTAVVQAAIWHGSRPTWCKILRGYFSEHFFPHRALSRSNSWKQSVVAWACNISHTLVMEPQAASISFI